MSDLNKFVQPISEFCKGMLVGGFIVAGMIWFIVLLSGCSTISVVTPDGQASYTRIGNQDISGLRFERDALGVMRLTLDKQSSDSDVLNVIRQLVAP